MDMQKECYYLRCELDTCQQKLAASMQSIKQFWSPELKKERHARKEETAKYSLLLEQYKLLQAQYQSLLDSYEQQTLSMQQLHAQVQQLQEHDLATTAVSGSPSSKHWLKEKSLLKKTINELEMRIAAQKQSLATKDETIKKLFQLVKTLSNKQAALNQQQQQQKLIQAQGNNNNNTDFYTNNSDNVSFFNWNFFFLI